MWKIVLTAFIAFTLLLPPVMVMAKKPSTEELFNSYIGHNADEIVQKEGPPTSTYTLSNGNKVLTWESNFQGPALGVPMGYFYMVNRVSRSCQINFTVDKDNSIVDWSYRGNGC